MLYESSAAAIASIARYSELDALPLKERGAHAVTEAGAAEAGAAAAVDRTADVWESAEARAHKHHQQQSFNAQTPNPSLT